MLNHGYLQDLLSWSVYYLEERLSQVEKSWFWIDSAWYLYLMHDVSKQSKGNALNESHELWSCSSSLFLEVCTILIAATTLSDFRPCQAYLVMFAIHEHPTIFEVLDVPFKTSKVKQ